MERDICLEILEGYGLGLRDCHFLSTYWDRLKRVARAGGYYGPAFKDFWGVNQGDPMSPTVFNSVVDAVVPDWVSLVAEEEERT